MILSKEVEMTWCGGSKERYTNLGYKYTKRGDKFNVKVEDLSLQTDIKIHVKCDVCGNEKTIKYSSYNQNILKNLNKHVY